MLFKPSFLAVVALLPASTLANFHIYQVTQFQACGKPGTPGAWCYTYGVNMVPDGQLSCTNAANSKSYTGKAKIEDFMKVQNGICNSGVIDFYRNGNGGFDIYRAGGNGQIVGRCYASSGSSDCWIGTAFATATDKYWCDGFC